MKVKIKLLVSDAGDQPVFERVLEFAEDKFELLTEDEISAAVETNVRTWAEQKLMLDWEVLKS